MNKNIILKLLVCLLLVFIALFAVELFNTMLYKIDLKDISKKNLLYYKQDATTTVNGIALFVKNISDAKYNEAFEMLDDSNKKNMFEDSVSNFKDKVNSFEGNYAAVKYNTIFSKEYDGYIDEEVLCVLEKENEKDNVSIRCNVRNYKNGKSARLIILNIK